MLVLGPANSNNCIQLLPCTDQALVCRFFAIFFVMPLSLLMNTVMHIRALIAIYTGTIGPESLKDHEVGVPLSNSSSHRRLQPSWLPVHMWMETVR